MERERKRELGERRPDAGRRAAGLAVVIDNSAKARRFALALVAVLVYLLLGQVFAAGFIDNWGYYAAQTTITLAVVLALDVALADEDGLTWQTHVIIVAAAVGDTVGAANNWYKTFDDYDKIIHFASGAAFAAVSYDALTAWQRRGRPRWTPARRFPIAVLVSFAVAGICWEVYEAWGDLVFETDRVQSRTDTVHDLISNLCGSILAGLLLWVRDTATRGVARECAARSLCE